MSVMIFHKLYFLYYLFTFMINSKSIKHFWLRIKFNSDCVTFGNMSKPKDIELTGGGEQMLKQIDQCTIYYISNDNRAPPVFVKFRPIISSNLNATTPQ